jgi:hypothetical protein
MIKKGLDIQTIANKLDRTEYAVKQKLIEYAIEMSKNDKSLILNDLCNLTTLSRDDLIEGFIKFNTNVPNEIVENTNIPHEIVENNNSYENIKTNIIDFIMAIACLSIGYYLYPVFNRIITTI